VIVTDAARVGPWVCEKTGGVWSPSDATAIGLEKNGELVAGVVYDHFNGASICMHVASDGSKKWLNREYLRFCFQYAFDQAKVKKVIGIVPSSNEDALRFDLHLGFSEEARIKNAHPQGDLILLTMTRQQCRWIKE
jgi:RimJ/RimL family protein N-acetyltransferase